jgi:2-oxoglutarate ferredoxin oxidoreductase subunit beta
MRHPQFPEPVGIFRAIQKETYDDMLEESMKAAKEARSKTLQELLNSGETWTVT